MHIETARNVLAVRFFLLEVSFRVYEALKRISRMTWLRIMEFSESRMITDMANAALKC